MTHWRELIDPNLASDEQIRDLYVVPGLWLTVAIGLLTEYLFAVL